MNFLRGISAVFVKDLQAEMRSRYAVNTVLAFVAAALFLILFSLNAEQLPPTAKSGLVWIIILFAALSSLSRSFVMETERQTFNLLRLHGRASEVFIGKLSYNFIFALSVNILTFMCYIFLLDIPITDGTALLLTLILGTAGLSAVATLLAAIVSQADRKGAIFSVLSIPLLVPLVLILVRTTKSALIEGLTQNYINDFWALFGFAGVSISAGIILFDYIWED